MEPFLTQLTELCRNKPWQTKWVIVPNHALGRMIGERLARAGVAWANLRFTPPFDLALQIAGADLASSGVGLFDEGAAPALVLRLLLDLPPVVTSYFRVLADQPGIAEALWSALRDLRFACLSSDRVVAEAFANADKQRELQALFTSYEAYLATNRLLDSAGVLELAAQRAADLSTVPADTLIEFPGTCTTLLERRFLDALPVDRLRARQIEIPGLQQPRRYAQFGRPLDVHRAPQEQLSDTDRLRYLLVPRTAPPPAGDGTLEMFRAAGVEAEVEEAFRRIASRRLSLDSVEIACAQPDRYAALLWEKARRQEWPVTLQMGVPGPLTGPVRAVLALCDWITSDFSAAQLVRMLQSGDLSPGWNGELTAVAAGRIIRSSGATSGRETYATCLAAEAAVARARSEDSEFGPDRRAYYTERAAQTEIIAEWLRELLESMPMPSRDGTVRLGDLVDACAAFASQASMLSGEDGAAAKAIPNALEALSPLTDLPRPPALILGLVRAELQGLRVCAEPPRSGSLYVTWLPTAGYSGRKHVFVLGLEEGAVFPRGSEDPVLLDSEREALAPDALAVSDDKVTQTVHDCIRRLASLQGNTCLSFSCRDLRKGRETLPSWIMLNAFLLLNPAAQLRYADFNPYVGEPVSVVPGEPSRATTSNTWWLATLRGLGPASMPAVLEAFSGLARGVEAESRRDGAEFTPYDGLVRSAAEVLEVCDPAKVMSASTLERLAACPFRHFLQYGLGVEAIEARKADPDVWLLPNERGDLLHGVYARFLRALRDEGRRPQSDDRPRLQALAETEIDEARRRLPPPGEGVFNREAAQIRRDVDLFLNAELQDPARMPVALEVSFGYVDEANTEPLTTPDPVAITLEDGRQIRLRGRIDRIDRLADGRYEIIDYKTGGFYRDRYRGTFAKGTLLQHALYSSAARVLLQRIEPNPRLAGSTYYFIAERGAAQRLTFPADVDVRPVLRDLTDVIASGTFSCATDEGPCGWCDYGRACSLNAVARSLAKRDSGDAALEAFRRLLRHA